VETPMLPAVKVIKLITGEEIIGILYDGSDEEQEDGYSMQHLFFVKGAMKVISDYDHIKKNYALYMIDWMPSTSDETLPIDKANVLTLGNPVQDLEDHYCEMMLIKMEKELTEDEKREVELQKMLKKHKFEDDDMQ